MSQRFRLYAVRARLSRNLPLSSLVIRAFGPLEVARAAGEWAAPSGA